jgi:hypothetical protein
VLDSSSHTITAQATDLNGAIASSDYTFIVSNPPTLTVTSPIDGQLVNGSLNVGGSFSTDKKGVTASVTVTLGQLTVLTASTSPFSGSFSLAGVTPGTYTVTTTATDSTGQSSQRSELVTVTSSPSMVYQPYFTLGAGGSILAAGGTYVLQSVGAPVSCGAPLPPIRLYSSASGDVTLPMGTIVCFEFGKVTDGGYVFASGSETGQLDHQSVYMWSPGGAAQNLSLAAARTYDQLLAVHYPWVLWNHLTDTTGPDVLYNVTSGMQFTIGSNGDRFGNTDTDFFLSNGELTVIYWGNGNILRWDQATNTSVLLASDGLSYYPQTDGTRVAWQTQEPSPGHLSVDAPFTLTSLNLASNTTQVLSTTMFSFQLANGLLGWLEQSSSSQAIKASDGTTISTVSGLIGSSFFGSSGGYIVFQENNKLYAWSVSGGRKLLFDAQAGGVTLTGKTMYFTNGTQQLVYGVTLP